VNRIVRRPAGAENRTTTPESVSASNAPESLASADSPPKRGSGAVRRQPFSPPPTATASARPSTSRSGAGARSGWCLSHSQNAKIGSASSRKTRAISSTDFFWV
jgi:hypothetical protein